MLRQISRRLFNGKNQDASFTAWFRSWFESPGVTSEQQSDKSVDVSTSNTETVKRQVDDDSTVPAAVNAVGTTSTVVHGGGDDSGGSCDGGGDGGGGD
jgi:hypothetical protein